MWIWGLSVFEIQRKRTTSDLRRAECDPENESGDADPGSENTNRACGLSAQTRVIGDGGLPVPFRKFCSV